ncbi:MAG TPA: non-ribosomal peptide synthetase [Cyanobacteria bacterium UBA8803]|nr:non-ribosomal peptide synthetase [Cyanobacteria bacterium UBA8803]
MIHQNQPSIECNEENQALAETTAAQEQILANWHNTDGNYPEELCIHQLFEAQVVQRPNAVAVRCDGQQLTYSELNAKANQLANYLKKHGINPEVKVGICLERSLDMVIAILGILKADGAYVPLDPAYPKDRLAFILEETQVTLLLTQQHLVEQLPQHQIPQICLDTNWEIIAQESQDQPESKVNLENLAYIMYTSGSTGQPKGVQLTHSNIFYYIPAVSQVLQIQPDDIYLHMASFSFSSSVRQLMVPLSRGATSIIATREQTKNPLSLFELIAKAGVTVSDGVHSVWRYGLQSLETLDKKYTEALQNSKLRIIVLSGDLPPIHLYKQLKNLFEEKVRIFNVYGQSETIGNCAYALPENFDPEQGYIFIPVGYPYPHNQAYILNEKLEPVAAGEVGELYMGGACLARGYLNRPDLNDSKFIPHPFSNDPQARLFKTGDLAHYCLDGAIELLGRTDFQVKIRGMRVELGEIETLLELHPSVKQAVVIARENLKADKRLVAYIITKDSSNVQAQLPSFLAQKLPDYMIPYAFVVMEAFPLTPNGKLDRNAFPAPDLSNFIDLVPPRTPTEEIVATIWAEVLGLETVGIHNNFFELGGHSLLAILILSRLQQALGVQLPLQTLFEEPTVAELADAIAQAKTDSTVNIPPLVPVSRAGNLPLSFTQTKLWFLDQLAPNSATYNMPYAYRLKGVLNLMALEQSLVEITRRHESLRTTFISVDGEPLQIIAQRSNLTLPLIDIEEISAAAREEEAKRLTIEEAQAPFNLAVGPLVRVKLLRLAAEDHILLVTLHHIISDGWSRGIFRRELAALYEAFSSEKPSPLPELPIQYADFAVWQRNWLQGEVLETQLSYWKQQLGGQLPVLDLPADRPRPPVQTYSGQKQSLVISPELTQALKTLSQKSGVTLFMTLLAAFQILLYRYSGQEDIIIGTPIAGRTRVETEGLIGFFVNTLALRTNLAGNPSFEELLERVREVALGAYAHQDIPFEKLVAELQPERDISRSPLFQVMFILQNTPQSTFEFPGLTLSTLEVNSVGAKFDLTLSLTETTEGILGRWTYSTDLFDSATITRMTGHFQTLLEGIIANPSQPICELRLLTAAERHQMLVEWNDTYSEYPQDTCIHQLFEAQVQRTPDALAVVFADPHSTVFPRVQQKLTYRELNNRANQLAQYLQKLGISPEVMVGIAVERSLEMIIGVLGILKAGGAYVPLDPALPKERLDYMIEDTGIGVLLIQKSLVNSFSEFRGHVVCLDSDWQVIESESTNNPTSGLKPYNLAYVIYTSGSTGKPKGVAVEHRNLCGFAAPARLQAYHVKPDSRVLMFGSLSFSTSLSEIFMTLLVGATLYVAKQESLLPGTGLARLLREYAITHIKTTPSVLAAMPDADFPALQIITVMGEPSSTEVLARWIPGRTLLNSYGATEVSVSSTCGEYKDTRTRPAIGRPISNTAIYILDAHLQPVPVNVPGEIFIAGVGVARGYLNQPDITAAKFISNPFEACQYSRIYQTGDLACYLPDGNIIHLGRIDNQVKIRGFRIELGEIQAVLTQHPHIQESTVIVREDTPGEKRLVAYAIPHQEVSPTIDELRRFLKQKLPDYMVPSSFVFLDTLPLLPNGKLDPGSLPVPDYSSHDSESTFVAPTDELELQLTKIWEQVLKVQPISINSNFFDLGGHSLLAVQLFTQIRKVINKDLPLATLFQAPTIAQLATIIRQQGWSTPWSSLVAVQPKGSQPPFFFHGGAADALSWARFARLLGEDQPFYALQRPDLNGQAVTHISVEELAAIGIKEIRTIQPKGPYLLGGHCFGGTVAFEMAQQLQSQGEKVALLALIDAYPPRASQAQINRNSLSFRAQASLHRWEFLLHKAYYYHASKLAQGGVKDKLSYIRQKLQQKNKSKQQRRAGLQQLASQQPAKPNTENSLPHELRYLRAEQVNRQASLNYVPQIYPDQITVFKASKQFAAWYLGSCLGWDQLTVQDVESYQIPGLAGNLFNQASAPLLAKQLKACLDKLELNK